MGEAVGSCQHRRRASPGIGEGSAMVGSLRIAKAVAVGKLVVELGIRELASFQGGALVAWGHRIIDRASRPEDLDDIMVRPSSEVASFVARDTEEEFNQRTTIVEASTDSLKEVRRTVVKEAFHPSFAAVIKDNPFAIVVDTLANPWEAATSAFQVIILEEAFDHIVEECSLVVVVLASIIF